MNNIVPFATREASDWTETERAEFFHVQASLGRAGIPTDIDYGISDEGDPWLVFQDPETQDVWAHFARIDRTYIVEWKGGLAAGKDFRSLVRRLCEALVKGKPRVLYTHPLSLLAMTIAALATRDRAEAAEDHERYNREVLIILAGAAALDIAATLPGAAAVIPSHQQDDSVHIIYTTRIEQQHDSPLNEGVYQPPAPPIGSSDPPPPLHHMQPAAPNVHIPPIEHLPPPNIPPPPFEHIQYALDTSQLIHTGAAPLETHTPAPIASPVNTELTTSVNTMPVVTEHADTVLPPVDHSTTVAAVPTHIVDAPHPVPAAVPNHVATIIAPVIPLAAASTITPEAHVVTQPVEQTIAAVILPALNPVPVTQLVAPVEQTVAAIVPQLVAPIVTTANTVSAPIVGITQDVSHTLSHLLN